VRRAVAITALVAVTGVTGCTPAELDAWLGWHAQDPAAAVEYANQPDVQASLRDTPAPETNRTSSSQTPGDCQSYRPLFAAYGLPVDTFTRIAWRESGCDHRSFVIDRDDAGGGLLGINLKGRLAATWNDWCGVTLGNVTDAEVNVRCAAVAYRKMGMAPWR
jgi:hypothetical protein